MKIEIKAIEYYLPPQTEDGRTLKDDNPEWRIEEIEQKTGISVRYVADSTQTATDMAALAAEKLFISGIQKEEIDFLIIKNQKPFACFEAKLSDVQIHASSLHLSRILGAPFFQIVLNADQIQSPSKNAFVLPASQFFAVSG